jgi:hypothetical protein
VTLVCGGVLGLYLHSRGRRSVARRAGIFQFAHRYDVAVWFHIDGRLGARLKEFGCRSIVEHLAGEAHKPGSYRLHRVSGPQPSPPWLVG